MVGFTRFHPPYIEKKLHSSTPDYYETISKLKMLPFRSYKGVNLDDPLRFYYFPILGKLYRRRVECCLSECTGGERLLEVGFGSGVTFLSLNELYQEIHGLDLNASVNEVENVFIQRGIKLHLKSGSILNSPYPDHYFDTVLLISILEHLKPHELSKAFSEIQRILKPKGQAIYGVPIERPLMVFLFFLLGFNIRKHHFSTEKDVKSTADQYLKLIRIKNIKSFPPFTGYVYEIGHFIK